MRHYAVEEAGNAIPAIFHLILIEGWIGFHISGQVRIIAGGQIIRQIQDDFLVHQILEIGGARRNLRRHQIRCLATGDEHSHLRIVVRPGGADPLEFQAELFTEVLDDGVVVQLRARFAVEHRDLVDL